MGVGSQSTTAGLILAAGEGARFGAATKQLAELGGRFLLEWAISAQCAVADIDRVVVVLGAYAQEIMDAVDIQRAEPVICDSWRDGQSASLRAGVQALGGSGAVIVTLGDAPFVTAEVISRFVGERGGTRATYGGKPGHPVVLGAAHLRATRSITGDSGARSVLGGSPTIECGAIAPLGYLDVDTAEDLERARNWIRR